MPLFINENEISITEPRKKALNIIKAGLDRVLPGHLIRSNIGYDYEFNSLKVQNKIYDLIQGRIFVIGGGKAAGIMAKTTEEIIGPDNITAGAVCSLSTKYDTEKIKLYKTSHPVPDKSGAAAVKKILGLKKKYDIGADDLVVCLISGGASAMMPCPVDTISLKDKQSATKLFIESGAGIDEINTIRKHLSKIKGGRLGEFFSPAKVISVIISDVVGNDLGTIGSGPTVPDPTTFKDAYNIVLKYGLLDKLPRKIRSFLEQGNASKLEETPKELNNTDNFIIGDNSLALEAMALEAQSLGLNPKIITPELSGDPEIAAKKIAQGIISGEFEGHSAIIAGGETTPALPVKHGRGGRNQHFIAAILGAMQEYRGNWTAVAIGTDGADYTPETAGAIADKNTLALSLKKNIKVSSYIERYDTYNLFKKLGNSHIKTGATGTNVGDIVVFII